MPTWQEQILEAAERVVRLRDELRQAEARFFGLTGSKAGEGVAVPTASGANGTRMVAGSLAHRIVDALGRESNRKFSVNEIAQAIGQHKPHSMRSTLARLTKDKRITRPTRGRYRAAKEVAG